MAEKSDFNEIEFKKPFYKIKKPLRDHLQQYSRLDSFPISYEDLLRYRDLMGTRPFGMVSCSTLTTVTTSAKDC